MGWLFGWDNRRDLIEHLSKGHETEHAKWTTAAKYLSGNVMWVVHDVANKDNGGGVRFIACYLLQGKNGHWGWGYKDMEESMHPFYYSCPPKFLEMTPAVGCQKWRDLVLAHWAARREGAALAKTMAVGDKFRSKASGDVFELVKTNRRRKSSVVGMLVEAKTREGRVMPYVGQLYSVKAEHVEPLAQVGAKGDVQA